jgi:hypothetical protein
MDMCPLFAFLVLAVLIDNFILYIGDRSVSNFKSRGELGERGCRFGDSGYKSMTDVCCGNTGRVLAMAEVEDVSKGCDKPFGLHWPEEVCRRLPSYNTVNSGPAPSLEILYGVTPVRSTGIPQKHLSALSLSRKGNVCPRMRRILLARMRHRTEVDS